MKNVFYHKADDGVPEFIFDDLVKRHTADRNITYKNVDGEDLDIAVYFPSDFKNTEKYPLFVMIHGGGWASRNVMPDQEWWSGDYLGYLARYYADKGFVVAAFMYRLVRLPQNNDRQLFDLYTDSQDALNYIADHADELCADLSDVTILGESAGGHLAAAMVTNSYHENRLHIDRAVLVNPVTDLCGSKWGITTPESSNREVLRGKTKDEINKILSPLHSISANTPPCILIHGAADSVVDPKNSEEFYQKLEECGVKCELHYIEGSNHAFLLKEYYQNSDHTKIGIKIIDDYLEKERR
ncbi:MAG: alpha/beta hydrolase [Ruminococcaceae bacterium]|nr:alpha/beta hydrolase [Oscillospiraceae bacterium]